MGRRVVVGLVVVVLFVAAGAAFAILRDDDESDTAGGTSTTAAVSSTVRPGVSATSSTTAPTTTAPSTTLAPGAADTCGAEGAAIQAAVDNGVDGASARAEIDQCRRAPVDTSWAAVRLVAKPGADFGPTTVVLHGGGGSWAVVGTGGTATVCNQAPQQVLVDLGVNCSSGGGGGI